MRKVIVKEHDCNRCARKGCNGDVIRNKKGDVKKWLSCPGQVEAGQMKTTLLERASENEGSIQALGKILSKMDLQFDMIPRYPYFRFLIAKTDVEII